MRNRARLFVLSVGAVLSACGFANRAAAADKSRYTLLDPTPRELMREFSTDRPDVTESAYTVDAGHFQVELSLVEYVHHEEGGTEVDQYAVLPSNIKVGLLHNVDLQLVLEPYIHQRIRNGDNETLDGFGATQLRMKVNLWGNDGGDTALALMPFVQFQTADNDFGATDHLEGGLIVPFALALPQDWSLSAMVELDFLRDEEDDGYGVALVHTIALGHPIAGELGGYVEYVGIASEDLGTTYISSAGAGLTYGLTPDVQLDTAVYFGISESADDFEARLGLSFRI